MTPTVNFTVYDTATGEVLWTGQCAENELAIQAPPGRTAALGAGVPGEGYWNGQAFVTRPPRPSAAHDWSWANKGWTLDLGRAKTQRWDAIKAARDAAEFGGFTWDGSRFDSDAISQSRIQGAAQLAQLAVAQGQPFSIDWTLADNSTRTLDGMSMIAVGVAMGEHIGACHAIGRQLRIVLAAATTLAEVEAVQWP
jgi:hypothetical protein